MADLTDVIDQQLKEYAARVRASMPPTPHIAPVPRQRRAAQVLVAVAAVSGIVTTAAVVAGTQHSDRLHTPGASSTPTADVPTVTSAAPTPAPTVSAPSTQTSMPAGKPALQGTATTAPGLTVSADGSRREAAPRAAASSFELLTDVYADASGRVYLNGRECGKGGCVKTLRITTNGHDWRDLTLAAPAESPEPIGVDEVAFTDPDHGYLSLANGTFRTSDGGHTWDRISRDTYADFRSAGKLVYAFKPCSGADCLVSHVVLDGSAVRKLPAADLPMATGIWPAGGSVLYLNTIEHLFVSTDGGQTFARHDPPCTMTGSGNFSTSETVPGAWFMCDGRMFVQDFPTGAWVERTSGIEAAFAADYPADRVTAQSVTSFDGMHAFATLLLGDVNGEGRDIKFGLATTADGGATWRKPTLDRIVKVVPTGPTSAVALYEPPAARCNDPTCVPPMLIAHTTDGGATWTELPFPS